MNWIEIYMLILVETRKWVTAQNVEFDFIVFALFIKFFSRKFLSHFFSCDSYRRCSDSSPLIYFIVHDIFHLRLDMLRTLIPVGSLFQSLWHIRRQPNWNWFFKQEKICFRRLSLQKFFDMRFFLKIKLDLFKKNVKRNNKLVVF